LFVNADAVVFLIIMFTNFCGLHWIVYLANTYTCGRVTSSVHLCLIPPYVSFENRIESSIFT